MESGWAPHDLGKLRFPNSEGDPLNEPASSGDSAQLALWLALHVGAVDLFDDVERIVRARLLPSQITEDDVQRYPEREFTEREMGAWGVFDATHGAKSCTPDIVASVAHTLCDIYNHIYTQTESEISIHLHFDREDKNLFIKSTRDQHAKLLIRIKHPVDLRIRIPGWASVTTVKIAINGEPQPMKMDGNYAKISKDNISAQSEICLTYDLPEKMTEELMPSVKRYRFKWRGDEIIGIDPQDGPIPFYPSWPL
jgi:DUF1680 family protein